ncbi:unnamed protein product, partial [Choristocarpus tenellus]
PDGLLLLLCPKEGGLTGSRTSSCVNFESNTCANSSCDSSRDEVSRGISGRGSKGCSAEMLSPHWLEGALSTLNDAVRLLISLDLPINQVCVSHSDALASLPFNSASWELVYGQNEATVRLFRLFMSFGEGGICNKSSTLYSRSSSSYCRGGGVESAHRSKNEDVDRGRTFVSLDRGIGPALPSTGSLRTLGNFSVCPMGSALGSPHPVGSDGQTSICRSWLLMMTTHPVVPPKGEQVPLVGTTPGIGRDGQQLVHNTESKEDWHAHGYKEVQLPDIIDMLPGTKTHVDLNLPGEVTKLTCLARVNRLMHSNSRELRAKVELVERLRDLQLEHVCKKVVASGALVVIVAGRAGS